ncbi:LLM class flavin-dependent oxidoreductase [Solirubrobacter soli]|uniref:LLM class flavin-dependent oxidoreductase n=1 Tax=Solirubrobacter soli TaxID=363832 RepID=UPI0004001A23|nr:LLM class flavin-dependent oxidoreductase [Solirubrobacter soli]
MTLSVLDLAPIGKHETARDALEASVRLAQRAEELGYERVWYAEHHNFESIASSATSVVIAHVAAHTSRIRLGAGGVMLPNHAPLVIAEQFGTLATLHPDRIDLGLGRAPGTNQATMRALRRDATAADTFPQDVLELQGYLSGDTKIPTVHAIPGRGTNVPLYILGSSLFGAQLAAALGLPYAFASHFSPGALQAAVRVYREQFQPSAQLERPYVIAAVNVLASDSVQESTRQLEVRRRMLVRALFSRPGHTFTDDEVEVVLHSPQGAHIDQMLTYTAAGTADVVKTYLDEFRAHADADELILAHQGDSTEARLRSLEIVAETAAVTSS